MPPKRKAKTAAKVKLEPDDELENLSHEDLFHMTFDQETVEEGDSDHSDWGSKRKPRRKKAKLTRRSKPQKPAMLPDMSDSEYYDAESTFESPELTLVSEQRRTKPMSKLPMTSNTPSTGPHVLQIHVDTSAHAPAVINLNLADLLTEWEKKKSSTTVTTNQVCLDDESTLVEVATPIPLKIRRKATRSARKSTKRTGFLDLPYEIRCRVYRQTFVTETPIEFATRQDFARSSAFLRTCSRVHAEGRAILYGENAFHFERTAFVRGSYFVQRWKEIGFKDVRRFLQTIGDINISHIKYVSFLLFDASPGLTPEIEEAERRFANDPVLLHVFDLIGHNAILSKLAVTFAGRRAVGNADYHFLKSLTSMRCHEFIHAASMTMHYSKIKAELVTKMQKVMVIPRDDDNVDVTKKKASLVKMFHEKPTPTRLYGRRW